MITTVMNMNGIGSSFFLCRHFLCCWVWFSV